MRYYIVFYIAFTFYCKNLICQEMLNHNHLDSIVTSCMKEHINFLVKGNFLKKNDKLYFKDNDFYKLNFSQWNTIKVKKVNYLEVEKLTKNSKEILLFYVYPTFKDNKILLHIILLSSKRKRKHYTQLNFSTGIFEISFDCSKNSYYYKVVKQFQGGEW